MTTNKNIYKLSQWWTTQYHANFKLLRKSDHKRTQIFQWHDQNRFFECFSKRWNPRSILFHTNLFTLAKTGLVTRRLECRSCSFSCNLWQISGAVRHARMTRLVGLRQTRVCLGRITTWITGWFSCRLELSQHTFDIWIRTTHCYAGPQESLVLHCQPCHGGKKRDKCLVFNLNIEVQFE